jgi:beta-fructofuranosidase
VAPADEAQRWLELAEASTDHFVRHAMFAVHGEMPRVADDPDRPVYHFRCPARWMNDANGFIHHGDFYHVFYQLNPYSDAVGVHSTVWGHARSRDLVHWEHLPVALSAPVGVVRINSGCAVVNGHGRPMLFVPAVFDTTGALARPGLTREIWAAIGDDDLIEWKFLETPIMMRGTHGGPDYEKWDAPYIFQEHGRTLMILSSCHIDGRCLLPLYETTDPQMLRWDYLGLVFDTKLPGERPYFECPMLCKDGDRWMMTTCGEGESMQYYAGAFDLDRLQFEVTGEDVMQYGAAPGHRRPDGGHDRGFVGSSMNYDQQGRCLLLGWQSGFKIRRGWNGCMGLPRVLTIGADGSPRQQPVPELEVLRHQHFRLEALALDSGTEVLQGVGGDTIEIWVVIEPGDAGACGLRVRCGDDGTGVEIRYDGRVLAVDAGRVNEVPLERGQGVWALELRVFLDKSVMEIFANGGLRSISRVMYPPRQDTGLALFAEGGSAFVRSVDVWQMKPIWGG